MLFRSPYDLSTTRLMRANVLNRGDQAVTVTLEITGPDGPVAGQQVELPPGEWTQVKVRPEAAGDSGDMWAGAQSVRLRLPAGARVALDDVTFRRPPNIRYELYKFIHCTIPTLAGLLVMLVGVTVLRFDEVGYVIQWVKDKGWKREKPEELEGETADEGQGEQ